MGKITIGEGFWSTIYGYLNSMFSEIYSAVFPGFHTPDFANPLDLDGMAHKNFICEIEGDTVINLNDTVNGDCGLIEILIDETGGYTVEFGTMFTKQIGWGFLNTSANADNYVSWINVNGNIIITIVQENTIYKFQTPEFADPLDLDATVHKDFKCGTITGNTTVNLNNSSDGDAGTIELIIDDTGGYTVALGDMFTKNLGGEITTTANADNIIFWRNIAGDIVYGINQVETG